MKEYVINVNQETTGTSLYQKTKSDLAEDQPGQADSSTGATFLGTPPNVFTTTNIIKELSEDFDKIKTPQMRDLFLSLFQSLQNHLVEYTSQNNDTSHFPPIHIKILEDESILIEWIFTDFRINFSIEPEIDLTSWLLFSNDNLENESGSGFFNAQNIDVVNDALFTFIIKNT